MIGPQLLSTGSVTTANTASEMPKLDGTHLPKRLAERLADLRAGKEVAARDIKALLSDEQTAAMDAAWAQQQALRRGKRARTKEEEQALGWKTKRDIHIEAYEQALTAANGGVLEELERLLLEATKRQMRIHMSAYGKARDEGKDKLGAKNLANNDLTRAGLSRLDGQVVGHHSKRDKEVWALEQQILEQARSELTPHELEQIELWEQHQKALREKVKKRPK